MFYVMGGTTSFPEEEEEESGSVEDSGDPSVNELSEEEKGDGGGESTAETPPVPEPLIVGRQPVLPSRTLRRAAQRSREKLQELVQKGIV